MTALIVGASSGLGRALAYELAANKRDLLLVASDRRDLDAIGADLHLRHGVDVRVLALDIAREPDPGTRIAASLDGMQPLSALLLPLGYSRDDDDFGLDASRIGQLLAINLHAPLAIVHSLLPDLVEARGVVVLFSSVAAIRGRGQNVVYAAAKRGLVSVYESLRQHFGPRELRVQLYLLGFIATNLTFGMHLPLPSAKPQRIAAIVARRLTHSSGCWYVPVWWRAIGWILRLLPWAVYRRLRQ